MTSGKAPLSEGSAQGDCARAGRIAGVAIRHGPCGIRVRLRGLRACVSWYRSRCDSINSCCRSRVREYVNRLRHPKTSRGQAMVDKHARLQRVTCRHTDTLTCGQTCRRTNIAYVAYEGWHSQRSIQANAQVTRTRLAVLELLRCQARALREDGQRVGDLSSPFDRSLEPMDWYC